MHFLPLVLAALVATTVVATAHETRTFMLPDGTTLQYVLVLPDGFDPAQKYEALLAFPGGDQTLSRTTTTVERFWEPEAVKRGVIVVAPVAPSPGRPFYMGEGRHRRRHAHGVSHQGRPRPCRRPQQQRRHCLP